MKTRRTVATIVSAVAAAGSMGVLVPAAHADTATQVVTTTVVGSITLTVAPAAVALVPPASLPGNATGSVPITVTSNTAYNVTVAGATAKLQTVAVSPVALGSALRVTASEAVAGTTAMVSTAGVDVGTSAQKVIGSNGGLADAMLLTFSQPLTAADATGLYTNTLTYTTSAGL